MRSMITLVGVALAHTAAAADVNTNGCVDAYEPFCVDNSVTLGAGVGFAGAVGVPANTATVGSAGRVGRGSSLGPNLAVSNGVVMGNKVTLAGSPGGVNHTVGDRTIIGSRTSIGADAGLGLDNVIGRACTIGDTFSTGNNVTLGYAAQVGQNVTMSAGTRVGNLVQVGDFATLGAGARLSRAAIVDPGTGTGAGLHSTLNGTVGPNVTVRNGTTLGLAKVRRGATVCGTINDGAVIGRGATVACGATIGAGAVVRAGATVGAGATIAAGATVPRGTTVASPGPSGSPLLWVKADAGVTLGIGSSVAAWTDQTTAELPANDFTMPTAGSQPTLVAGGLNGLPIITEVPGQYLESPINAVGANTVIYVARANAGSHQRVLSASSNNWLLGYHTGNIDAYHANGWVNLVSSASPDLGWHVWSETYDGTATSFWRDRVALQTNVTGAFLQGPIGLQTSGAQYLQWSDASLAEIIVYDHVITPAERIATWDYLTAKWGVAP